MSVWTFITRLPWRKIGGYALKYWYIPIIGLLYLQDHHRGKVIHDLRQKISGYTVAIDTLDGALKQNKTALNSCLDTNAANQQAALAQKQRADDAAARIAILEATANQEVETIRHEVESTRTDLGCPAITDEFRRRVRDTAEGRH